MTVSIAWVRRVGPSEQLLFVSDSRLSGGRYLDHCSKILPLSRRDSAVSFAGDTDMAYPLLLQFALAAEHHAPARERALDIVELHTHGVKVLNSMAGAMWTDVEPLKNPDASFLFGGYSWRRKCFRLWSIRYNATDRRFDASPAPCIRYKQDTERYVISQWAESSRLRYHTQIAFGGDWAKEARRQLLQRINARHATTPMDGSFALNWEPFEVVRDLLRQSGRYDSIGGAPQVVRIDQHINARPLGVWWPDRDTGQRTILGRPTLGYENLDIWTLDPDTLTIDHPRYTAADPLADVLENAGQVEDEEGEEHGRGDPSSSARGA